VPLFGFPSFAPGGIRRLAVVSHETHPPSRLLLPL
jgi:hypothetical protein